MMRKALLFSCLVTIGTPLLAQQAPAPAAPRPAPTQPATPAQPPPARRPSQATVAARTGMTIVVTDPQGMPLGGIRVEIKGPSDRGGTTDSMGQLRVTGMQVGTYRLRFLSDTVITFEREVTVRAGQTAMLDVTLNPAPPPPAAAPPPPAPAPQPAAAPIGPAGEPQAVSLVEYLDRNLIRNNEPRRETLVSCSGNTRASLVQMNQDQPRRLYENAEVTYYVIAGEGALRVDTRETSLAAGSFISIPRGTGHELLRRGRRPLIVVAEISGEPCEEAR